MGAGTGPGRLTLGGVPWVSKSNALVRSPHTARRHALMFGSSTPVTFSRSLTTDVWSEISDVTWPPTVQGDTTVIGTRGPSPMGRLSYQSSLLPPSGRGATGGGTWSK